MDDGEKPSRPFRVQRPKERRYPKRFREETIRMIAEMGGPEQVAALIDELIAEFGAKAKDTTLTDAARTKLKDAVGTLKILNTVLQQISDSPVITDEAASLVATDSFRVPLHDGNPELEAYLGSTREQVPLATTEKILHTAWRITRSDQAVNEKVAKLQDFYENIRFAFHGRNSNISDAFNLSA